MAESEYRLLLKERRPEVDPVPVIVTRPLGKTRHTPKSSASHLWELLMAALPTVTFGIGIILWAALHQTPQTYALALSSTPQPETRSRLIDELEQQTSELVESAPQPDAPAWDVQFTQPQLNSWLADRFPSLEGDWRQLNLQNPRLLITPQSLEVGVQVQNGGQPESWTLSIRPSVQSPTEISLQLLSVRIGLLPIPLNQIKLPSEGVVHGADWDISWQYSSANHRLTFQIPEEANLPAVELVELQHEQIRFQGKYPSETTSTSPQEPAPPSQSISPPTPQENAAENPEAPVSP